MVVVILPIRRKDKKTKVIKEVIIMSDQLFAGEDHTAKYRVYRPNYPEKLFEHILNYYFDGKNTNEKIPLALDVGCGSGQATVDLSR